MNQSIMQRARMCIGVILLAFSSIIQAVDARLFVSNNTSEITELYAYHRLTHLPQEQLLKDVTHYLQTKHIEQGEFENVLGVYTMLDTGNITSDNTLEFDFSPYQILSEQQIFTYGKELAIKLKQESVAVFLQDDQKNIGRILVTFTHHKPTTQELNTWLTQSLPYSYQQAYSISFSNSTCVDKNAHIKSIEWLGSDVDKNVVKQAFPNEKVTVYSGSAYLIYSNGAVRKI